MEKNFKETRDNTLFTKFQFSSANVNFKRVLGVEWNPESDLFVFQFDDFIIMLVESLKPTKKKYFKN